MVKKSAKEKHDKLEAKILRKIAKLVAKKETKIKAVRRVEEFLLKLQDAVATMKVQAMEEEKVGATRLRLPAAPIVTEVVKKTRIRRTPRQTKGKEVIALGAEKTKSAALVVRKELPLASPTKAPVTPGKIAEKKPSRTRRPVEKTKPSPKTTTPKASVAVKPTKKQPAVKKTTVKS